MNEFTKDELETIALWFQDIPGQEEWPEKCSRTRYYRNLEAKIKHMIDNYCEHLFCRKVCINCGKISHLE